MTSTLELRVDNLLAPPASCASSGCIFRARGAGSLHTALLCILPIQLHFSDHPPVNNNTLSFVLPVHSIKLYMISTFACLLPQPTFAILHNIIDWKHKAYLSG